MNYCDVPIGNCVSCLKLCVSCKRPSPDCLLHCNHDYTSYCMGQNEMRTEKEMQVNVTKPAPIDISVGNPDKALILLVVGYFQTY